MLKILGKMVIWQSDIRKHQPSLGMAIFLWCFNLLFVALALALLLFDWPLWIRLPLDSSSHFPTSSTMFIEISRCLSKQFIKLKYPLSKFLRLDRGY